ncbi:prestin-like isoform X2 [Clavelina lepadiformis]|uniref:prestin-like isoform X2 n=1 Tax=Clavelina lepadiformis TaxID=159417 RepID=UPI004041F9FA
MSRSVEFVEESNKTESHNHVICRYLIDRPTHTEPEFREKVSGPESIPENPGISDFAKKCVSNCTAKNVINGVIGLFPILTWLRHYNVRQWLPGDLVSGLTVGVIHIPQSMAFSLLAGLPPVFGLYSSFYPVLIYTLMGTSRHISVGTFAVTSLLTQAVVIRFVPDEPAAALILSNTTTPTADMTTASMVGVSEADMRRVAVASSLMLLMGVFQLVFGILRLGFITAYLSEPLIQAFTTGAAIHVVTSQVPSVLGYTDFASSNGIASFYKNWFEIFRNLPNTHVPTLVVSIVSIGLLVTGREINLRYKGKLKVPIPTEVIVVIIATVTSHFAMLKPDFGVVIVDNIPTGLPAPRLPDTSILINIIGDAFAIAIVGFAISISLSKMYAQKYGYQIDSNQELIAYGASNVVPAFFLCFPNAAALARCVIQENTGGKTQVVGLISVVIVLVTVLWLGPIFEPLPRCVLGCIIIVGLFGILQQFSQLKPVYKMSKIDFVVWIVTLLAVVTLGVDMGLLAGVVFSVLSVIFRTQTAKCEVLGSVAGTDIYRNCHNYLAAVPYSGIVIFKFHSALYYANKDFFKKRLIKATGVDPEAVIVERKKLEENSRSGTCCCVFRGKKYDVSNGDPEARSDVDTSKELESTTGDNSRPPTCGVACEVRAIVLDCSAISFLDLVGVKTLKAVCENYKEIGVDFLLAAVNADVRKSLLAGGYYDVASLDSEYVSVHDAAVYIKHFPDNKMPSGEDVCEL